LLNLKFHIEVKNAEDIGEDITLSLLKTKPQAGVSETTEFK
jgi:hypothetical protein